ncbi:hypothetical protein [Roseicyclus persicicus]|uniref:Uncharacterized protein n=1 Tax=Roseicyclus persicicus TaxID=2650661 RepID=A0A7X6GYW9_9RHOB|nr:hypothetical protein [Roseibacterium persicicum]NKX44898.1 hypothetical protein [Roseibacterium persicicum]
MVGAFRSVDRRRRIGFDWMLIAAALVAGALLAGTVIRSGTVGQVAQFGTQVGGLRSLGPNERLVVFEDMSSGAGAGWSGGRRDAAHVGLGAIWLADPPHAPLTREIALPEGTVRAVLSLDLIAIDAWAREGLELRVNGAPVLRQRFGPDAPATETIAAEHVTLRGRLAPPQALGFDPAQAEQRLSVAVAVTTPGATISLAIHPLPADGAADGPAPTWAVDNLIVVAESLP